MATSHARKSRRLAQKRHQKNRTKEQSVDNAIIEKILRSNMVLVPMVDFLELQASLKGYLEIATDDKTKTNLESMIVNMDKYMEFYQNQKVTRAIA